MSACSDDDDSDYEDIGKNFSQYEQIEESIYVKKQARKKSPPYTVSVSQGESSVDLKILENQYYHVKVLQNAEIVGMPVERRFSDFALLYDILQRKNSGYIFPAFPENGLFAYMKSKLSVSKDEQFLTRRMKMIERFFCRIFLDDRFDPLKNTDIKSFFVDHEMECIKKTEREKSSLPLFSWNKLKSYFHLNKTTKYAQIEAELEERRCCFEIHSERFRVILSLLFQEQAAVAKLTEEPKVYSQFVEFAKCLHESLEKQRGNLRAAEDLQFQAFCLTEDVAMARKVIDNIEELKSSEENYRETRLIEPIFEADVKRFMEETRQSQEALQKEYSLLLTRISNAASI